MSEKIDYIAERDNIVGWALLSTLSALNNEKFESVLGNSTGHYEIFLTICGVECSFAHIINKLKENIDDMIITRAEMLLEERLGKSCAIMDEILDDVRSSLREKLDLPTKVY